MQSPNSDICLNCLRNRNGAADCPHCGAKEGQTAWKAPGLYPGTLLAGKYLLGRVLGHGGFAVTYLAVHLDLGIRVAIKEYFPGELADRDRHTSRVLPRQTGGAASNYGDYFQRGLERFIEEGRNIVRCHEPSPHPNLVHVIDYFEGNGTAYLVMGYVDGISLEEYLKQQPSGRIGVKEAVRIVMPVLDGLRAVHNSGFCHLDVKPANIYLSHNGPVILLDFGTARSSLQQEARTQTVFLTPGYAPPEQYSSKGGRGPWSDVYGCAATLYRCVTGMEPASAMDRMAGTVLPGPSEIAGNSIPRAVDQVIMKGLENNVSLRPQSAKAYQDLLHDVLSDGHAPGTPNTGKRKVATLSATENQPPRSVFKTFLFIGALVFLVAVTIAEVSYLVMQKKRGDPSGPTQALSQGSTMTSAKPVAAVFEPVSAKGFDSGTVPPPANADSGKGAPAFTSGDKGNGTPSDTVTLLSPNGGESWECGTSHQITWASSGIADDRVCINYYYEKLWHGYIAESEPNDGSYTWTIPADWPPRNDYRISIHSTASPEILDFGDGTFAITAKGPEREPGGHSVSFSSEGNGQWDEDLPCGLHIDWPSRVSVNSRVQINVTARNVFRDRYVGTLAVTFEGGKPSINSRTGAYDVLSPEQHTKITVFRFEGSALQRTGDQYDVFPRDTHVEIYDDAWEAEGTRTLSVPVVFREKGPVLLKVRSSFTRRLSGRTVVIHNCPEIASTQDTTSLDEQGFPCHTLRINVVD